MLQGKNKIALFLPWLFAFTVRYLVFAVKYLVLPWGLWFCREGFGFVVRYFVFAGGFWFCREVFGFAVRYFVFAVRLLVLPWQLWATVYALYHGLLVYGPVLRAKNQNGQSFSWMFLNRKKLSQRDLKSLQKVNFRFDVKISQIRDQNEHINNNNKQ